jgi:hypothetical protein
MTLMGRKCLAQFIILSALGGFLIGPVFATSQDAEVTRIIRDVKLLPAKAKPRPALLNDKVTNGSGVRTGNESRSELTFADLTIERLGSNTLFSFDRGGRTVHLDSGSVLLRVPKNSGGATMSTSAVAVGVTGTTLILESHAGRNKLIVLEGSARVSLNRNRSESVYVRGGQMEDVPAGATKLPPPVNVNLSDIMKHHPLITDFGPLPSRDLIMATASNPTVYQGQPVDEPPGRAPSFLPSFLPSVGLGVIPIGGGHSGGGHVRKTPVDNRSTHYPGKANTGKTPGTNAAAGTSTSGRHPSPTPSPGKKKGQTSQPE